MIEGQGKSDTPTQANNATVLFMWTPWFDFISHALTLHQQVFLSLTRETQNWTLQFSCLLYLENLKTA